MFKQVKNKFSKKIFVIVSIIGVLFSFVFTKGITYSLQEQSTLLWSMKEFWWTFALLTMMMFAIAFLLSCSTSMLNAYENFVKKLELAWLNLQSNIKSVVGTVITVLILFGTSCAIEYLWVGFSEEYSNFNKYSALWIFTVMLIAYITFKFRKNLYKYAHIYFFIVTMLVGSLQIVSTPRVIGVSWDDQIHYGRTAYLSWLPSGKISLTDERMIIQVYSPKTRIDRYESDERESWAADLNQMHRENRVLVENEEFYLEETYVAYIPGALGLILGRGLGLDYIANFMVAKFFNLLLYAAIVAFSIKILERGRLMLVGIALIPTNIFLVTGFSYDWWVTMFVILGYSMLISELQSSKKIKTSKMILIMAIMIIGIMPKAIYFPLVFPMMLLNKERYENPRIHRLLVIIAMLILIATFLLPMLVGGAGTGDLRGGSDVNSTEQINFILNNPSKYASILAKFLLGYLCLDNARFYMTAFAYMGDGKYYTLCVIAIVVACIVDSGYSIRDKKEELRVIGGSALAALGSIVLVATAMYVSFTSVASETIAGCQYRYIIPVLFPACIMFLKTKISATEQTKGNAIAITTVMMVMVFLSAIYDLSIVYYYA